MKKSTAYRKELKKLNALFESIPENKKELCTKLIENAAYMSATLDELQAIVNEEGAVITTVNGNGFETTTEHPAQKSYNTTLKNYTSVIKQLTELLPERGVVGSKLEKFLND